MKTFEIDKLAIQRDAVDKSYLEFLRVPSLSMGLYELAAGQEDPQQPHHEDEVYYVIKGRARIRVGEEDHPVQPGSIIYVGAFEEHNFHSITENLTTLVFFAPAES
jgi:mannose-6-phosphate isomerase-like protein (cupin superfamily)